MSAVAYIANSGAAGSVVTSGSTATVTLGAAVRWSDRIVVVGTVHDSVSNSISSVTDSLGNVYTNDANTSFAAGAVSGAIFSSSVTVAGTPTITINFTTITIGGAIASTAAYSGTALAGAVDVTVVASSTSTNATTGATLRPTTGSNELVIGGYFDDGESDATIAAGAGFTARASHINDGTNCELMLEDMISTTPATQTATAVNANHIWGMMCVVYRLSSTRLPNPTIRPHAFSPGLAR